eukprot:CAMPEP_0194397562 /NCGR_PEP_ID=MMETSP0174-20130528/125613_1 /TAXON_ID=216777 /ORGANISM="Proboscia alata, Strain PI-D3" /LENGTH=143 /DNA_ID=CAMNT_0039193753 /DNA_START=349 /DNA_END=777 /DNA_ORIENTATION=-
MPTIVTTTGKYHAYDYDKTETQFTPDGRLLQLEYATLASLCYSNPIIALPVRSTLRNSNAHNSHNDGMVIATVRADSQQTRFIEIPVSKRPGISGGDQSIVLCLNGVLADNLALVSKARKEIASKRRRFGCRLTGSGGGMDAA